MARGFKPPKMKTTWLSHILHSFDFNGVASFCESLAPSFRYGVTKVLLFISLTVPGATWLQAVLPSIQVALGIQSAACITLMLAFITELGSGIVASQIRKEQFSSFRLSRFSFKVCIYLVLIAIPYHWSQNFAAQHKDVMAAAFDWLQNFLIIHIALENMVSILENLSVIDGKDKTAWINAIKAKLTGKNNE